MKHITFQMATTEGETPTRAYVPFEGAEFCVHRNGWGFCVSHIRTGYRVPHTSCDTRKEALGLAERLHNGCPSAPKLKRAEPPLDGDLRIKSKGPHKAFVAEAKAVLGLAA